jgi:hypothetical protein
VAVNFVYQLLALQLRKELLKKSYRHWSEDISINKVEQLAAILINYMPGLLLPAYSLLLDRPTRNSSEKIGIVFYHCLLCVILLFPFVYLTVTRKNNKKNCNLLRSSDVETLSQYGLNLCMSVTLGIRDSPLPFLITGFVVLSALLVYSFMEGSANISCGSMPWKKVNTIIHKLTFWLYHLAFITLFVLASISSGTEGVVKAAFDGYVYYCSILCLCLFLGGGCH